MAALSNKQKEAAALLAGGFTFEEVQRKVGVALRTIYNWRQTESFQAEQTRMSKLLTAGITLEGIARKEERVRVKQELHNKLLQIVRERQEAVERASGKPGNLDNVPGVRTGLLVKRLKTLYVGGDREARIVREWITDTNLVREVTNLHEAIAKELGQTVDTTGADALKALAEVLDKRERADMRAEKDDDDDKPAVN